MRVLVTGAAGFIGSHVVDRLVRDGHDVVGVDNFSDYYSVAFKEQNVAHHAGNDHVALHRIDITNLTALEQIYAATHCDVIIHLAAQAGVRISTEHPIEVALVNDIGTYNVFELARRHGVKQVVFASSSSVYGNSDRLPFTEDDPVAEPISFYAATKRSNELTAYTYHHLFGMNMIGLRFFTVYGERGRPDMSPYVFADMILNDKPLRRYGDGSMARDFTYIDDVVSGVVACIDKPLGYALINLGNSTSVTLNEYIGLFEKITGKKARIEEHPVPAVDVRATCANIARAQKLLGWHPTTDLETGLRKFIDWFIRERQHNPF